MPRTGPAGQPLRGKGVRFAPPPSADHERPPHPPFARSSSRRLSYSQNRSSRIAQTVGSLVLKNGGVVRGLANWGVFSLPKPVSVHQMKHTHGHYFVMRYDASTKVHHDLRNTLRLEPRMIRSAHVKLGDGKLETLSRFGAPRWRTQGSEA
ncbi:37S ribosomal protein MRP17, mitochondrial [Tolypocladium ophioglossoides CBS 100239]|uniref:37S ribosomal protein MRP17, mitochondrial n=1 Tax=Tolypocladium ophioglossoides (strain CBS 100239) TaxID=1163406 RepID=A0A0L0NA31_TOLOC|nr:37S ribosomal protein MRP17, mitochondrial [Tolypocladium ophioglossoides CBS 100239]